MTVESMITTLNIFRAHFMLRENDAASDRKSILLYIEDSIRNSTVSASLKMSPKNTQVSNRRFTSHEKMCIDLNYDRNWSYQKKKLNISWIPLPLA